MKRRLRRGTLIAVAGFLALFGLRLAYGFWSYPQEGPTPATVGTGELQSGRKNYASSKLSRGGTPGPSTTFDQKYERVAEAALSTPRFAEDEEEIRSIVKHHEGLIQAEQASGLAPARSLRLVVGVDPRRFDELVAALGGAATLTRLELRKTDKTNDYLQLKATRRSLEKSMAALTRLQEIGGALSSLIELEGRILEREKEIQEMGVQLGEFDEEYELCTVDVTLKEQGLAAAVPGWPQRVKVAFEWSLLRYLLFVGVLALGALFTLLALLIADKLGAIRTLIRVAGDPGSSRPLRGSAQT